MQQRLTPIEEYLSQNNTLLREVTSRIEDRISLEIGDSKAAEFIPQAKILRWDNEVNFSIRRDNGARSFVERDGKIVAEGTHENVVIYELAADEVNEDGGLEIEIELPRRSQSNVFDFTLETKGLTFHYQPPLTPEEIAAGDERPENVAGSYAVYHAEKQGNIVGGKHYKTGKAFHIYRPKAIDALGAEVWCELSIDEVAGILTVTVPDDWLRDASYPVRVDPTFGYTSVGASASSFSSNTIRGAESYAPATSGNVTTIYAYSGTSNNILGRGVLYLNSDNSRVTFGAATDGGGAGFQAFPVTSAAVSGGVAYKIALWFGGLWQGSFDSFSGKNLRNQSLTYSTVSDPPATYSPASNITNRAYSMYAEYEEPPAGPADLVATQASFTLTGQAATLTKFRLVSANSCDDATGFENLTTPADTSPFTSGESIQYTLPEAAALPLGTYYWRVRAIDPTGSNTFGAWSATRTFTLEEPAVEPLLAGLGTFTLTGQAAALLRNRILTADQGTFTLTGQEATFTRSLTLSAEAGAFTLSGQEAAITRALSLSTASGTFTLTGYQADFNRAEVLVAAVGSFSVAGQAVEIRLESVFLASTGTFTLTAPDTTLALESRLSVDFSAFSLSGQEATFRRGFAVPLEAGAFTLTGSDATFRLATRFSVAWGVFTLTGSDVVLDKYFGCRPLLRPIPPFLTDRPGLGTGRPSFTTSREAITTQRVSLSDDRCS